MQKAPDWEALRQGAENNTELLDRIVQEWQEQKAVLSALTEIGPSPSQALGRVLLSYELLQRSVISIQPPPVPLPAPPAQPTENTSPAPMLGGLENNSDDW